MVAIKEQVEKAVPAKISWERFEQEYLHREDGYRYEWVDGAVEKSKQAMNSNQFFVIRNLILFSYKFINEWTLIPEGDTFFQNNHRRPDAAFYTNEQIKKSIKSERVVPPFVIEIISKNDNVPDLNKRLIDFRKAGVKVVWVIHIEDEEVHVYEGKKAKICSGKDKCSAEKAIKGFILPVSQVFNKDF